MISAFDQAELIAQRALCEAVAEAVSQYDAAIRVAALTHTDDQSQSDMIALRMFPNATVKLVRRASLTMQKQHTAEADERKVA